MDTAERPPEPEPLSLSPQPQPQPPTPPEPLVEPQVPVSATAPAPRRRWGRTALLIASASVIGLVGGTAVGYKIQADRPPTPLPALSQPGLAYPAKPLPKGQEPAPLSAAEDRRAKTDGDLRKLLVPKPKGAEDADGLPADGTWSDLTSYALTFESDDYMFEQLAEEGLRRVADIGWAKGNRTTLVRLVQFRSGYYAGAAEHAEGQRAYMPYSKNGAGNGGTLLKGTADGRYYVYDKPDREPGYLPLYKARAVFHRGDVMVDIWLYDTKRIAEKDIRTLAERQLERL
ncbi:hypothetical protein [Streptomyces sp. TRM49041]|uniref:hypothetical protein n=1 Tax=Streptomyces sp. TRM49041 TaxID=2603216 RepID=UPI0021CD05A6|nr:hypothetical protein [Streptomyces sp. TRM49041]